MINLTNNQVEAFNRLFGLRQTLLTHLVSIINFNVIKIVVDSINKKRFYFIRKSVIECKSFKILDNNKQILRGSYTYKLKKR